MNPAETARLLGYYRAARQAPRAIQKGRRSVKSKAMHYGVPLKYSRVHSMSVETQHFQRRSW